MSVQHKVVLTFKNTKTLFDYLSHFFPLIDKFSPLNLPEVTVYHQVLGRGRDGLHLVAGNLRPRLPGPCGAVQLDADLCPVAGEVIFTQAVIGDRP